MKKRTKKLLLRFARSFQGHWPKIIKVFLLLFVHKKKFFLFFLLFKIIFPFLRLGSCLFVHKKKSFFFLFCGWGVTKKELLSSFLPIIIRIKPAAIVIVIIIPPGRAVQPVVTVGGRVDLLAGVVIEAIAHHIVDHPFSHRKPGAGG